MALWSQKKKKMESDQTFRTRVDIFWKTFSAHASKFKQTIDDGKCADLTDQTIKMVSALAPGLAWVYGPGLQDGAHSLTVSGEGRRDLQFLTRFWAETAPGIENWDFFPARQPSKDLSQFEIKIGDVEYSFSTMWLVPTLDVGNETVDIRVWHPNFDNVEEEARFQILFLMLDEALGEWGTENWIGKIEIAPADGLDAVPLADLPEFVAGVTKDTGWSKGPPDEMYAMYELPGPLSGFIRGDCIFGATSHWDLIGEYIDNNGKIENPLEDTGADFVFLRFNSEILPAGREIDVRSEIQDKLDEVLAENFAGRSFGGGMSDLHAYLDFVIFDGANSIELMLAEMRRLKLPTGSSIHYFSHLASKDVHIV